MRDRGRRGKSSTRKISTLSRAEILVVEGEEVPKGINNISTTYPLPAILGIIGLWRCRSENKKWNAHLWQDHAGDLK